MRLMLLPVVAVLALAAPASADPVVDTCSDDDYTVARVEAANVEVAHVCTSEDPRVTVRRILDSLVCVPCIVDIDPH